LDRSELAEKLAMSERVARYGPLIPWWCDARCSSPSTGSEKARVCSPEPWNVSAPGHPTILILEQGRTADPGAVKPLLAMAKAER